MEGIGIRRRLRKVRNKHKVMLTYRELRWREPGRDSWGWEWQGWRWSGRDVSTIRRRRGLEAKTWRRTSSMLCGQQGPKEDQVEKA